MKQLLKFSFASICITIIFAGCKKINDFPSYETKINFTYNGQQYSRTSPSRILSNLIIVQNEFLLVNFAGLEIDNQNLLGGNIYIAANSQGPMQCAFLSPTGSNVYPVANDCNNLQSNGGPIDSVNVYWYESGSVSYNYSDCKSITTANVPGQKDCMISGNFDLTLTNKNNEKIRLTNGSFTGRLTTYP